jgi:hypothetical protein
VVAEGLVATPDRPKQGGRGVQKEHGGRQAAPGGRQRGGEQAQHQAREHRTGGGHGQQQAGLPGGVAVLREQLRQESADASVPEGPQCPKPAAATAGAAPNAQN